MTFKSLKLAGAGLAVAIAFGVAASQGYGEIAVTGGPKPAAATVAVEAKGPKSEPIQLSASLWVQCWQYGVKIIDEKDVSGIRLQNLIERDSLGFRGRNSVNGDIYVVPVNGDSTCLIKPAR
jgi:hypothetical protein